MIQLKLGPARPVDPGSDDMGREWVGWTPDQTEEQLYERNRGLWLLGPKADRQRYATGPKARSQHSRGTRQVLSGLPARL